MKELLRSTDELQSLWDNAAWLFGQDTTLRVDAGICEFWQHAQNVYDAVSGAWVCECRSQHNMLLLLQNRQIVDTEMRLIITARPITNGAPLPSHGVVIREPTAKADAKPDDQETLPLFRASKQPKSWFKRAMNSAASKNKTREQAINRSRL